MVRRAGAPNRAPCTRHRITPASRDRRYNSRPQAAASRGARPNSPYPELIPMSIEDLESIAQAMVAPGKGIIAIDESNATIKKRFDSVKIENTEENRRAYREMLLTVPK